MVKYSLWSITLLSIGLLSANTAQTELILLGQSLSALQQAAPAPAQTNPIPDGPRPPMSRANSLVPTPSPVPAAPPMDPVAPTKPVVKPPQKNVPAKPNGPSAADLASGKSGLKPAKVEPVKPKPTSAPTLIEEIQKGKDLKKAEDRKLAPPVVQLTSAEIERNKKIKEETELREKRRKAIAGADDDDSDSDNDDWAV